MKSHSWNYYSALDENAVDVIKEACLQQDLLEGLIGMDDDLASDKKIRRSKIAMLDKQKHSQIFNLIYSYALDCNRNAYGFSVNQIENCQFSIYDSADKGKYDWHYDTQWGNITMADRKISMVLQLSNRDEYKGGEFEIENVNYSPEDKVRLKNKGAIITFPSFLRHRVTPVTEGRRMSLIAWVEGPKFR